MMRLVLCVATAAVVCACAQPRAGSPSTPGSDKVVFTGDQKADWAQITALEDQAKAIARTDGCATAGECRTAPVGNKACGGPRYYLVYCSRSTDSVALFAKLKAVLDAEAEFNKRYQLLSTCEFRLPPKVALVGMACQAQQP
jgi:hypothetical protein